MSHVHPGSTMRRARVNGRIDNRNLLVEGLWETLLLLFNNKIQRTWKNAMPNEMPAIIPRLASITVVTSVKQPYTAGGRRGVIIKDFSIKKKSF